MNKIALITGASSGIGKDIAIYLSNNGYIVYAGARRVELIDEYKSSTIVPVSLDVTSVKSIKDVINLIESRESRLDLLVNNAGYGIYGSVEGLSIEDAKKAFEVNLFGLGSVIKEVLPIMRREKSGTIVNISSFVGKMSMPILGWYSASKHALEGLTDALRLEVKPFNINVSLILPGTINTGFEEVAMNTLKKSKDPNDYNDLKKSFTTLIRKSYKVAPKAYVVIHELKKLLKDKSPKARYIAGSDAKTYLFFRKLFSDKIIDKVMARQFNIK